jgi:hypothetical protein
MQTYEIRDKLEDKNVYNRVALRGKVKMSVCMLGIHMWGGGAAPFILDHGTSWMWVVSSTIWQLFPCLKNPQVTLSTGLGGPMSPAGRLEERKISCDRRDSSYDPSIVRPEVWSLHRLRCTVPSMKLGLNQTGWVWCWLDDRRRIQRLLCSRLCTYGCQMHEISWLAEQLLDSRGRVD